MKSDFSLNLIRFHFLSIYYARFCILGFVFQINFRFKVANDEGSSELDIYLMERPVPRTTDRMGREFDVLSWWKRNSLKYPVLSELVKDVLAVQISSVASESAFSTSGRILDPYRSCLTPYMIEALVCTQQWLRNNIHAEKVANLVQMFEELDFHESLGKFFSFHFFY